MTRRSSLAGVLCTAALLLTGCAEDDAGDGERIRVPQLRMIDGDGTPLTLGATDRVDGRNRAAFERASLVVERTVAVRRPADDGSPTCLVLGRAGPDEPGDSDTEVFPLDVDAGSAALVELAGLVPEDAVSLLVFWSARDPDAASDSPGVLLDAAAYEFEKAEPGPTAESGEIFLRLPPGAPPPDADGVIAADSFDEGELCGPLDDVPFEQALNPDGDALISLVEINVGLPATASGTREVPVSDGGAVPDGVDVFVVADTAAPVPAEPLVPTWRIGNGAMEGGETLRLPPSGGSDEEPLELRLAVTPDGTLLIEAVLPPEFANAERTLQVRADYSLEDDGGAGRIPLVCSMLDTPMPLSPLPRLDEVSTADGSYLDAEDRVLARCSSPGFGPGQDGLRADDTFSLLFFVDVTGPDSSPGPEAENRPVTWETPPDGERVLVYREPSEAAAASAAR